MALGYEEQEIALTRREAVQLPVDKDQGVAATTIETTKERWNAPRTNVPKVAATYWCFLLLGCNDSSYGVNDPTSAFERFC